MATYDEDKFCDICSERVAEFYAELFVSFPMFGDVESNDVCSADCFRAWFEMTEENTLSVSVDENLRSAEEFRQRLANLGIGSGDPSR